MPQNPTRQVHALFGGVIYIKRFCAEEPDVLSFNLYLNINVSAIIRQNIVINLKE